MFYGGLVVEYGEVVGGVFEEVVGEVESDEAAAACYEYFFGGVHFCITFCMIFVSCCSDLAPMSRWSIFPCWKMM